MKLNLLENIRIQLPDELETSDSDEVAKIIKNDKYFPNQALVDSIRPELIQSIMVYGSKPENNPFLRFAMDEKNEGISKISTNLSKKLYNAFAEEDIDFGGDIDIEKWVFSNNAYNGGEYKLNLFLIMSDPDQLRQFNIDNKAFSYIDKTPIPGDVVNGIGFDSKPLFDLVLDETDTKKLGKLVDKFQSTYSKDKKDDDEDSSKSLEGSEEEQKKKLFDYFRKRTVKDISDDDLNKIINNNYKAKMDLTKLKSIVNKAIDDVLKIKLT